MKWLHMEGHYVGSTKMCEVTCGSSDGMCDEDVWGLHIEVGQKM